MGGKKKGSKKPRMQKIKKVDKKTRKKVRKRTKRADIEAAGGVIVRTGRKKSIEIAVVHRPKYDDWSLPKGKLDKGEKFKKAALREVREETGLICEPIRELSPTIYAIGGGKTKLVRYWLMDPIDGSFEPNNEVDELRWLDPAKAADLLSYRHDRDLVLETIADL